MTDRKKRGLSPVVIAVFVASLVFAGIILIAWQSYRMIDRELTTAALSRRAAMSDLAAATLSEKFDHLIDISISLATRVRFRQLNVFAVAVRIRTDGGNVSQARELQGFKVAGTWRFQRAIIRRRIDDRKRLSVRKER